MKKIALLLSSLLLVGCASTPYGTGDNQGYFLGQTEISSNVPNICKATNGKYAIMEQQYWLAGGAGLTSYGCVVAHQENLMPKYMLSYYVIKNDGTVSHVLNKCVPVYSGKSDDVHFTKANVVFDLTASTPKCKMILS